MNEAAEQATETSVEMGANADTDAWFDGDDLADIPEEEQPAENEVDDAEEAPGQEEEEEAEQEETEAKGVDVPYKRFKKVNDKKKAADERAAKVEKENQELRERLARLEGSVSNLSDVKALLEPKKAPATIDDELKQFGIDPKSFEDSYDDEGNLEMSAKAQKKLALQEAKTNATIGQIQAQNTISRTAGDVNAAIMHLQTANPEMAEMLDNGLTLLVSNQAFIMQANNPQMSEQDADAAAYNAIMFELARRSQQTKKSPALIAAEMADGLAKRLNIPLAKPKGKQDVDKSGINMQNREESKARAGKPPIQAASKGAIKVEESDSALFARY